MNIVYQEVRPHASFYTNKFDIFRRIFFAYDLRYTWTLTYALRKGNKTRGHM